MTVNGAEYETLYLCKRCLGTLSAAEIVGGHSPCCGEEFVEWGIREATEFFEWLDKHAADLKTSHKELLIIRKHVRTMHSDSKKRRKTYNPPKNTWPGRLSQATTKRGMRTDQDRPSGKTPPPIKNQDKEVDITLFSTDAAFPTDEWTVEIIFSAQDSHTIVGTDRADARRKARQLIRKRGKSITTASQVSEEDAKTIIEFE